MRVNRRLSSAVVLAVAVLAAAACDPSGDDPTDGVGREAAVYDSLLVWMLDEEPAVVGDDRPEWTMYVASRHERPIGVDVQVRVVETLDPRVVVRFIDERSEAVDEEAENQPVRVGGILVGLGAVPAEGDRVDVYLDRYRDVGDVRAWDATVRRVGDTWEVDGVPVEVDVRPLPPGE